MKPIFSLLLNVLFAFIRFSGIGLMIRLLYARKRLTIIVYHNPSVSVFSKHIEYLTKRYHIVSVNDVLQVVRSGDWKKMPPYALLITIDDGWKENFQLLPVFVQYKIRPVIFLTSGLINTNRHFWWTECSRADLKNIKRRTNQDRLNYLKNNCDFENHKEYATRQALNMQEIEAMNHFADFGAHSVTHPILPQCNDDELHEEISLCKSQLESMIGTPISVFAYPNGDIHPSCFQVLEKEKFLMARTIDAGWNHKKTNPYLYKVTGVSDSGSVTKMAAELTGVSLWIQHILKIN